MVRFGFGLWIGALAVACFAAGSLAAQTTTTLRQAAAQRALLIGAAADADEFNASNKLNEAPYANTLGTQFNMLEPENAMKWNPIHPAQNVYNFSPADKLVAFAASHQMQVRGHNLLWYAYNPQWVLDFAKTASTDAMAAVLKDHITTVVTHYKGQVFAWDVVNEAIPDTLPSSFTGTPLRDSIWYNQPGIGQSGTGFIEQSFRWAHEADPNALLFYNEYNIEGGGAKFNAMYAMLKDFTSRGVPINGVGLQMHITTSGFPSSTALTQVIQQITALGLQVHITEMDVRIPVNASSGLASSSDLQTQADTYARILGVCLQNPGCTAFQTWGFTDKYSWIPGSFPNFGAALPFDANYAAKPVVTSLVNTLQSTPPKLSAAAVVNAASYQGGSVAPGELVTIFGVNDGPASLVGLQLDGNGRVASSLSGVQVTFDGVAAPLLYVSAGQVSAIVPYEVAGKQQTMVQYAYQGVLSNTVTIPVAPAVPGVFSIDASGQGAASVLNSDYSVNSAAHPAAAGSVLQIYTTGGGAMTGSAVVDGSIATGLGGQVLPVTATIGGHTATVQYAGPAPQLVNGVMQVNVTVPAGLSPGAQPLVVTVGGVASQSGLTVTVQ